MRAISKTTGTVEMKIPVKLKLSALWTSLMFLYIYADWFSLYRTGQIEEIISGRMRPFLATQGSLFAFSIVMSIPSVMIFLTVFLRPLISRWANIILGGLYTLVNIGNLVGETWAYYYLFGLVEIIVTLLVIRTAWLWHRTEDQH